MVTVCPYFIGSKLPLCSEKGKKKDTYKPHDSTKIEMSIRKKYCDILLFGHKCQVGNQCTFIV